MKNSLVAVVKMNLVMFCSAYSREKRAEGGGSAMASQHQDQKDKCKEVSDLTTPLCEKLGISMRQQLSLTMGFVCV